MLHSLSFNNLHDLGLVSRSGTYDEDKDRNIVVEQSAKDMAKDNIFTKGQSKRIWGELYKVANGLSGFRFFSVSIGCGGILRNRLVSAFTR